MGNQEQQRSVLLIGVPDAGKTNFIFRFWLRLDLGDGILKKAALPDDMEYLKTGADHLLNGDFAPRTAHDVIDRTEIPVKTTSEGHEFLGKVVVPDLPGEQTLTVFRSRQWASHWEDEIRQGCGCLLFVRVDSDELVAPIDWVNCPANFGAPVPHVEPAKDDTGKVKPPTQVVLVEWLQFLRKAFTAKVGGAYKPRIGIVVSAWDLAPNDQKADGPVAWVKGNLPLLSQFIRSNDEDFEFAYFGVSVASGDLKEDASFKAAYLKGNPRKAGEVVHDLNGTVETSSDVTLPVAWALGFPYANATASLAQG
jgi:Double-GTPase 1